MSKRAALYIRVSSDEQARHGLSLGEQRADLLKYAESHGYAVVDVYADEGATARKAIKQRRELQRLLADVEAGRIDVIVIKCLDRWSRNIADFYETQKFLEAHDVVWECTQEKYNTSTASGRLHMNIRMSIAQDESDRTSERIKYVFEGKKERKEILTGNLPLGYQNVDKHAVPDENARVVRFLFEYIDNGGSARSSIRVIVEKFGVKLSNRQIYNMLRNKTYIGEMHNIPDYCPSIVPYDLFQRVQNIVHKHRKKAPSGRIYIFSGLLRCPSCGRILGATCGRKNAHGEYKSFQYKCERNLKNIGLGLCEFSRSVFESTIERQLLANLKGLLQEHIHNIEVSRAKERNGKDPEAQLALVKEKLIRLKDIYLDGMIDKELYEKEYVDLKRKVAELSVLIDKAPVVHPTIWQTVEADDFIETYYSLTQENKRKFWRSLVERINFEDTPESRGRGGKYTFHVVFL